MRAIFFGLLVLVANSLAWGQPVKVLVLPLAGNETDPIGQAVRASMVADLSRQSSLIAQAGSAVADSAAAIESARKHGSVFVIFGQYQTNDGQLRFTGQIVEVDSARVVGGLKTTGLQRDLFGMEDDLSSQAIRQIIAFLHPPLIEAPKTQSTTPYATQATPVPAYTFEGSDLERSLNWNIRPSSLYDVSTRSQATSRYYGDQYVYYPSRYAGDCFGWQTYYPVITVRRAMGVIPNPSSSVQLGY